MVGYCCHHELFVVGYCGLNEVSSCCGLYANAGMDYEVFQEHQGEFISCVHCELCAQCTVQPFALIRYSATLQTRDLFCIDLS